MSIGVDDQRSTPKLSLSRLPCKPKQPIQMLTPPLHPSLSIPFQWEEAPGKPRHDAPPHMPSAIKSNAARTCLDSHAPSPSGSGRARMGAIGSFGGSRRWRRSWGSFKFREEERGNFDLSHTLGDFFMSERKNVKKKMGGTRRVFDLSTINSNLLNIYARFKQAIPWRRRR